MSRLKRPNHPWRILILYWLLNLSCHGFALLWIPISPVRSSSSVFRLLIILTLWESFNFCNWHQRPPSTSSLSFTFNCLGNGDWTLSCLNIILKEERRWKHLLPPLTIIAIITLFLMFDSLQWNWLVIWKWMDISSIKLANDLYCHWTGKRRTNFFFIFLFFMFFV